MASKQFFDEGEQVKQLIFVKGFGEFCDFFYVLFFHGWILLSSGDRNVCSVNIIQNSKLSEQ